MNIYISPRRWGKTTEAIRTAAREHATIVCFSHAEAVRVAEVAKSLKLEIPRPIPYDELPLRGLNRHSYIYDNADLILQQMAQGNVLYATWTDERQSPNMEDTYTR